MYRWLGCACVALGLLIAAPATALTVIVANNGTDSAGCGPNNDPCLTIEFALTQVNGPNDVVELKAGTHAVTSRTLVNVGGNAGSPLTIRGGGAGAGVSLDGSGIPAGPQALTLEIAADHVSLEDLEIVGAEDGALVASGVGLTLRRLNVHTTIGVSKPCVQVGTSQSVLVEDLVAYSCTGTGLDITDSSDVQVLGGELRDNEDGGLSVTATTGIEIRGVFIHDNDLGGAGIGVNMNQAESVVIGARDAAAVTVVSGHGETGIRLLDCDLVTIEHSVIATNNGAISITEGATGSTRTNLALALDHVTVANSTGAPAFTNLAGGTTLAVTNSVIAFNAGGGLGLADTVHAYNLRFSNGTGNLAPEATEFEADPLFADAASGDYHLRSTAGRFTPGGFINDAETSPAVDLADPAAPFTLETAPNGGRANAGAFGNTVEASRTPGAMPDAAMPDTAAPDTAAPDTAAPDGSATDSAQPDGSATDSAQPDAGAADVAQTDNAAPDVTAPDAGTAPDVGTPDSAQPDHAGTDAGGNDRALPDAGSSVDAGLGEVVIARAGRDLELTPPATFTLDGSASTAPEGARYVWTLADGPLGPGARSLGEEATVEMELDASGIFVFQLTVSAGGYSDSDLIVVTLAREVEPAVEGCGCVSTGAWPNGWGTIAALCCALGMVLRRRKRCA